MCYWATCLTLGGTETLKYAFRGVVIRPPCAWTSTDHVEQLAVRHHVTASDIHAYNDTMPLQAS